MNRFLLIISLIFVTASSFAQVASMDTLYYDKDWKGVSSPHFATFYRVIEKNPTEGYRKMFRDYYRF